MRHNNICRIFFDQRDFLPELPGIRVRGRENSLMVNLYHKHKVLQLFELLWQRGLGQGIGLW